MAKGTCSVEGCAALTESRGWCMRHFTRWRRYGDPLGSGRPTWQDRFWAKVLKAESCWLWQGSTAGKNGRGYLRQNGRKRLAYRVAYEMLVGPVPDGLEIDHLCRVPACVNPAHLEAVTHAENVRRDVPFKRGRKHGVHERPASSEEIPMGKFERPE